MPTAGFILEKLSDNTTFVLSHSSSGTYTTTTVEDDAEFDTLETTVNGWRDLINANNTSADWVGTRPSTRRP